MQSNSLILDTMMMDYRVVDDQTCVCNLGECLQYVVAFHYAILITS